MRDIIFQVLSYLVMVAVTTAVSYAAAYLRKKLSAAQYERVKTYAEQVVRAVEQMAAQNGWTGADKKQAAISHLCQTFKISQSEAELLIEAAVRGLKAAGEEINRGVGVNVKVNGDVNPEALGAAVKDAVAGQR